MSARKIFLTVATSLMAIISVFAQTVPRDVSDLVGANAASGESELMRRGYQFVKSSNSNDRNYANWWKPSTKICLNVVTINGRYDSISAVISVDCDQVQGGNNGPIFGGGSSAGKVNVNDLVGIRASSGESEMESRGFQNVDAFQRGSTSYTIWWRALSSQCVQVATSNGQYDSLNEISSHPKCRQNGGSSGGGGSNNPNGLGGEGATVFEDSNSRGRQQSFGVGTYLNMAGQFGSLRNDKASSVMVMRGYKIRLCSSEGTSGSGAGSCEEYGEGSYNLRYDDQASFIEVRRAGDNNSSGGGDSAAVNVSDLVGSRSFSGSFQLGLRGFSNVDNFKSGNTSYSIWWRSASSQCIQTAIVNGRYNSVTDIGANPKCR